MVIFYLPRSRPPPVACGNLLLDHPPHKLSDTLDWTDMESFSRPPPARGGQCADPEASRGHRKNNLPRREDELFYGYYLSAAIMMPGENGPAIPELARRATLSSCRHDPVRAFVPVLTAMPAAGIPPGDVPADSGYAHRDAGARALPLRAAGGQLVQDLHPHDRGPTAPTTAPSSATVTRTARPRPARCWNSGRCPARPPRARSPRTTRRPPRPRPGALQARPPHPRRPGRLPPRPVSRRHRQDPLPAPPRLDDPEPGPARNPHPAREPPGMLHPAGHHRPARGERENPAGTRPPVRRAPPVLRPPHRRRARLRHRERPGRQHHHPRLVPPHGPDPPHAGHHLPAHRPQPAHPASPGRPAGGKRTPHRQRPAPENPAPAPQDAHRTHRCHRTALARPAGPHAGTAPPRAPLSAPTPTQTAAARPETAPGHAERH